jgi:hypothetical protein
MDCISPIAFDVHMLFRRAVQREVRDELTVTHGSVFATAFMEEHHEVVERVARAHLHGQSDLQVRYDLVTLTKRRKYL